MSFITADFVKETSATTGTGTITLSGVRSPGRTFSSVVANGDTFHYSISHQTLNEWETGLATMATSTTFTRTTVFSSSNANAAVNFSAGTKNVDLTLPSSRISTMGLIRAPQIVTSTNASFAHPTGTRILVVEGVGGGGASGGAAVTNAGSAGSGGNSGTWGRRTFTNPSLTSNITVGAGGTVGAAGAIGNDGGSSTLVNGATTVTLPGGRGGQVLAGGTTSAMATANVATSAATNADISITGNSGQKAFRADASSSAAVSGEGGSNPLGQGGMGIGGAGATSIAGQAGTGFGSGAGGRNNGTSVTATVGTAGQIGVWIIWEFS